MTKLVKTVFFYLQLDFLLYLFLAIVQFTLLQEPAL